MDTQDRLKLYQGFAEITRRWVTVMDAKAAFLSAMSGALLTFIWSGSRVIQHEEAKGYAFVASIFAVLALIGALWTVVPRGYTRPKSIYPVREPSIEAVSFYGVVDDSYKNAGEYCLKVSDMDIEQLSSEALQQHYVLSKIVATKERWVRRSGRCLVYAVTLTGVALIVKFLE